MPMPRLLIISYLFPPMGGIGVQRALSLAKYLPQCGFEVQVLKARNAAGPVHDPALLRHVPDAVAVRSAFTPEVPFALRRWAWKWIARPKRAGAASATASSSPGKKSLIARLAQRMLCPEPEVLWVPFALRKARRIVLQHRIQCVLVTAPPFSAFLVGNALKREFPDIKLVSDFRDEWLTFYLNNNDFQSGEYTRRRAAEIELATIQCSDLVVAVTDSSLSEIRRRYPDQPDCKFQRVANGFDPEAFRDFAPRGHEGQKVVVTHVGTVYKNSSPRYYLDALDELPEAIRSRIETRFIGRVDDNEKKFLDSRKSPVRILGFMPQAEAQRYMEETDYLLLTLTDDISLPGKLYEYLATGKPVLALSPIGGEVDRLLRETDSGWCVSPSDRAGIQALLLQAYALTMRGDGDLRMNWAAIRRYERPSLVAEYAGMMRNLIEMSPLEQQGLPKC
jgi:glycosyltransferase involved in cell wall biosynthesis